MATITPDQLTALAARAAQALPPTVNGRIDKAVRLVTSDSVTLHADGTAEVVSDTDGVSLHRVIGKSCSCPDYTFQAPQGWCCHRIAVAMVQRLTQQAEGAQCAPEEMPEKAPRAGQGCDIAPTREEYTPDATLTFPESKNVVSPQTHTEAPCSANVHVTIGGKDVLVTVRGHSLAEVLPQIEAVVQRYPAPQAPLVQTLTQAQQVPVCPWHGTMNESSKAKGTWYCPAPMADGSYCKERSPK